MSVLPASWCAVPLEKLCVPTEQVEPSVDQEFVYIDISAVDRQTKRIATPQRLLGRDAPSRARKLVRVGDTLVSMTRPNLNAVALVSTEFDGQIASTGFDVLRAAGLEPRWIAYLVRTSAFVEAMSALVQGALYPAVRSKDVRAFTTPVAPLPEQQRIADRLDTVLARVDACRDRLARIAPLLKRFRQSVLAAASSGQLTTDWSDGAKLAWPAPSKLGDFCDVLGGKRLPKGFELTDLDSGYRYVRVTDFSNFSVSSERIKFVPADAAAEIARYTIGKNDVFISIAGSIGIVGQVPEELDGANLTENAAKIVVRSGLLPRFLMYQLASPRLQDQMHESKIATTQEKLGLFRVKALSIYAPELEEQAEVARRVENLFAFADRLEARLAQAQTAADRLTPSLLAKAFRGELVPQDASDEPAAELLKRLAAQREGTPGAARRQRAAA